MNKNQDKAHKTVQKRASVHEKTVQAIAAGEVAPVTTPRRKGPQKPPPAPLHTDIKVVAPVMAAAKEIIEKGVYTTLEIIDNDTVILR